MIAAFVIWSLAACMFIGLGLHAWRAEKPVGFFIGGDLPKVKDVSAYNRAVARLWWVFALLFELLGLPLLFVKQNSPIALLIILGTVGLCIGLMVGYFVISERYRK